LGTGSEPLRAGPPHFTQEREGCKTSCSAFRWAGDFGSGQQRGRRLERRTRYGAG
jgi:hypothetical protein